VIIVGAPPRARLLASEIPLGAEVVRDIAM
jgi:hypothetical protein